MALGDAFDVWQWWRARLAAGWVRYAEIEEELRHAERRAAIEYPLRLLLSWWEMGLIVLQGSRDRFRRALELVDVPPEGRAAKFWRLDDEGLKHISSGAIFYDLELRLDPDFVAWARAWPMHDQTITVIRSYAAPETITLKKPDREDMAWLAHEMAAAEPEAPPPVLLTRDQAVRKIIAGGKSPGATKDYPYKEFEKEVRNLTGAAENARGYKRDALRRLFERIKAKDARLRS